MLKMLSSEQVAIFAFDTELAETTSLELDEDWRSPDEFKCASVNDTNNAIVSTYLCFHQTTQCSDDMSSGSLALEQLDSTLQSGYSAFCFVWKCTLNQQAQIECNGHKTYLQLPVEPCDVFLSEQTTLVLLGVGILVSLVIAICTFIAGFRLGFRHHASRLRKEFAKLRSMSNKRMKAGAHVNQTYNGLPSQTEPGTAVTTLRSRIYQRGTIPDTGKSGDMALSAHFQNGRPNITDNKNSNYLSQAGSSNHYSEVGSFYQLHFPTLYDLAGGFSTMSTLLDSTFDFTTTQTLTMSGGSQSRENDYVNTGYLPDIPGNNIGQNTLAGSTLPEDPDQLRVGSVSPQENIVFI